MVLLNAKSQIAIFDTTMRDGEMMPGVAFSLQQKVELAKLLEAMQVDVIEVGYPGTCEKDFDQVFAVSKQVKQASVCGLASSRPDEVVSLALALKPAARARINIFTPVNLKSGSELDAAKTLEAIGESVKLARSYGVEVQWSAFDAVRSQPDFLCRAVEVAIKNGASVITIPDSMGTASPDEFTALIAAIANRVPNIDQAALSVHCHDDLGLAVANSLAALDVRVRQIECSINGLGARKGNADLQSIVDAIAKSDCYCTAVDRALAAQASEFVAQLTHQQLRNKLFFAP